jgi:O-antigen/teichoic acid export membrane protein
MRSRVFWRRSATAGGVYASALLGFAATIVAARSLSKTEFGLLGVVLAATGFFQLFADLTVDEALVKYGFRYIAAGRWGRLRQLFRVGLGLKLAGGLVGAACLAVLAGFAHLVFGEHGLGLPILMASLLPLVQAPEGVAAAVLVVRRRYDVRAAFLVVSMSLRLAALALGAPRGVTAAVTAIVIAQVIATAAIGAVGWIAVRRYPEGAREPLAEDRADFRSFVVKSSIGSVLSPMRGILGTLLVGIVTGPLQVAYFRVAQAPQNAFAALSSPARLILLSEQTHQVESGRTDLLYRMLRRYVIGTTAAMVVLVPPLLWLTPSFIRFAYKDKHGVPYLGAVDAMRLMLIVGAIQVVWGWTKSYPVSIGRPELRIVAQSIEIAVLIPLLIVLASLYGATGAASAFLVASVVFALVWTVIVLRLRREPAGEDPATPELIAPEPLLP